MRAPDGVTAAIVLVGGRSSRMGTAKAALDWHGSTLLRRAAGLVERAVDGQVVVVRSPEQALPPLPAWVEVVSDPVPGRGPLQGIATGLEAVEGRAEHAYATATDVPLLHPAFIAQVVGSTSREVDVVLPDVGGHRQPLAACYRVGLRGMIDELIEADRGRPAFLFERCRVLLLDAEAMLRDQALARYDPELASVHNLNDPGDYSRALALQGPPVDLELRGALGAGLRPPARVRAWSLSALAAAAGILLSDAATIELNGDPVDADPELPLVAGDRVAFSAR